MDNFNSEISDEDFLKASPEDVMNEIDKQVDSYYQSQQSQNPNTEQSVPQEQTTEGQSEQTNNEIDPSVYKEAYDYIMQPFKASGKDFQLKDFHDARSLMQQGIDYTRKQQQLKPRLIEMRTLENNGMLGDNLNYAIELFQGKPEAIKKLIQDKKIDVNSLVSKTTDEWGNPVENQENNNTYTPMEHRISEEQYNTKEMLDTLRESPKYNDMVSYLNTVDSQSLLKFYEDPKAMKGLITFMEDGVHDKILQELTYARTTGNPSIRGLNDYDAYVKIGTDIVTKMTQQQNQQNQVNNQQYVQPPVQQVQQQYIPQQQQFQQFNQPQQPTYQQQVQQRKQAVSPIRNSGNVTRPMYDPLSCSDADFAKIDLNAILRM